MKKVLFIWAVCAPLLAASENIPSKGASYFDYLTEKLGISFNGNPLPATPHPYHTLVKKLNQFSPMFAAVIPFGRSLQKMAAYPNSLQFPRVLVATRSDKLGINNHFRGRLFIGYVEPSRKLEVISYNPQLARFEFQIVDNFYPGGKAVSRYASRQLCTRCHQGGVPIFAGGDWLEATALNHELRALVKKAIGADDYLGVPLARDQKAKDYDMVARPERFDDMAHSGAELIAYQRAWQDICTSSDNPRNCRQSLLAWMVITNIYEKISLKPDLELLSSFVQVMGKGSVGIPKHRIPDHNPVINGQLSYEFPKDIDPSLPREPLLLIMASDKDSLGIQFFKFHIFMRRMGQAIFTEKDFENLRKFITSVQPTRTLTSDWSYKDGKNYKKLSVKGKKYWCLPQPGQIQKILDHKPLKKISLKCFNRKLYKVFGVLQNLKLNRTGPLVRSSVLKELQNELKVKYWDSLCCQRNVDPKYFKASKQKTYLNSENIRDHRIKIFFNFCSECHLHQDLPPPFLAASSEEEIMAKLKKKKHLIQFRLQSKQMPPQFARRQPNATEREKLLQALQSLP